MKIIDANQRIVPSFAFTGYAHYHHGELCRLDGCMDATEWIPAGSTVEIPAEGSSARLISDRMVLRS